MTRELHISYLQPYTLLCPGLCIRICSGQAASGRNVLHSLQASETLGAIWEVSLFNLVWNRVDTSHEASLSLDLLPQAYFLRPI